MFLLFPNTRVKYYIFFGNKHDSLAGSIKNKLHIFALRPILHYIYTMKKQLNVNAMTYLSSLYILNYLSNTIYSIYLKFMYSFKNIFKK